MNVQTIQDTVKQNVIQLASEQERLAYIELQKTLMLAETVFQAKNIPSGNEVIPFVPNNTPKPSQYRYTSDSLPSNGALPKNATNKPFKPIFSGTGKRAKVGKPSLELVKDKRQKHESETLNRKANYTESDKESRGTIGKPQSSASFPDRFKTIYVSTLNPVIFALDVMHEKSEKITDSVKAIAPKQEKPKKAKPNRLNYEQKTRFQVTVFKGKNRYLFFDGQTKKMSKETVTCFAPLRALKIRGLTEEIFKNTKCLVKKMGESQVITLGQWSLKFEVIVLHYQTPLDEKPVTKKAKNESPKKKKVNTPKTKK